MYVPPLVFNETTSVLISRIQHNINFSDEIGHQLELRGDYKDNLLLLNISACHNCDLLPDLIG